MMDPELLERITEESEVDIELILAFLGVDLRALYREGARAFRIGRPEPEGGAGADRVRALGWTRESERG